MNCASQQLRCRLWSAESFPVHITKISGRSVFSCRIPSTPAVYLPSTILNPPTHEHGATPAGIRFYGFHCLYRYTPQVVTKLDAVHIYLQRSYRRFSGFVFLTPQCKKFTTACTEHGVESDDIAKTGDTMATFQKPKIIIKSQRSCRVP